MIGPFGPLAVSEYRRYGDFETCAREAPRFVSSHYGDQLVDSIQRGRLTYDEQAGASCVSTYEQYVDGDACSIKVLDYLEHPWCADVFTREVASGDACAIDEECISGRCEWGGEECAGRCVAEQCGEAECGRDEYCDEWTQSEPVCMPHLETGEECNALQECEQGVRCRYGGPSDGSDVCVDKHTLEEGDRCLFLAELCGPGLTCEEDLCVRTERPAEAARGQECGEDTLCEPGFVCRAQNGGQSLCEALYPQGTSCVLLTDCAPDLACVGASLGANAFTPGICASPLALGAACVGNADCGSLGCVNGQCAPDVCGAL